MNDNDVFDEEKAANLDVTWILDRKANATAALEEKLNDAMTPGFLEAQFTPDEADLLGAFEEDALSEQDAIDGNIDLVDAIAAMMFANKNESTQEN